MSIYWRWGARLNTYHGARLSMPFLISPSLISKCVRCRLRTAPHREEKWIFSSCVFLLCFFCFLVTDEGLAHRPVTSTRQHALVCFICPPLGRTQVLTAYLHVSQTGGWTRVLNGIIIGLCRSRGGWLLSAYCNIEHTTLSGPAAPRCLHIGDEAGEELLHLLTQLRVGERAVLGEHGIRARHQ